jgi:hypothetical protein
MVLFSIPGVARSIDSTTALLPWCARERVHVAVTCECDKPEQLKKECDDQTAQIISLKDECHIQAN